MAVCKTAKRTIHICLGIIIGFLLTSEFRSLNYENFKRNIIFQLCSYQNVKESIEPRVSFSSSSWEDSDMARSYNVVRNIRQLQKPGARNLLLIGVMTAKQFVDTRALIIYQTWAQGVGGHVIFFSSANSSSKGIPLVALPGVDDKYPPQKKAFLMFKFMNDFFGDKYKFFMRADDDVFVNVPRMKHFLRQLNSSAALFIGQTGTGNKAESGQLHLNFNENFCMGGPGIILSHVTLSHLAHNVDKCLARLYSTHEDVEIGRCVRKYAGKSCSWSYDMQNIFYHNASIQNSILKNVYPAKELSQAITIHPLKDAKAMKSLYLHYQNVEHQELRHKVTKAKRLLNYHLDQLPFSSQLLCLLSLHNESQLEAYREQVKEESMEVSLDSIYSPTNSEASTWQFFAQKLYSELSANPKRHIERHILQAFHTNMQEIMRTVNRQSLRKGRILDFNSLYYGYVKFDSKVGVQYLLDLLMIYRKYQGKRMTIPIRRHAYAIQTFSETLVRELPLDPGTDTKLVNVVVPLAGRLDTFRRFLYNFATVVQADSHLSLSVVFFPRANHSLGKGLSKETLLNLASEFQVTLQVLEVNGTFSRGVAFQQSLPLFADDSLLFFLDVDMHFSKDVMQRVRRNTQRHKQVYFPIVFSQYSNQVSAPRLKSHLLLSISDLDGYWRQFGFGIVALYKDDLLSVGGYDVNINGWGMEDVSLYDRFVASNVTIFRAVEPALVHIYHDIHCDPGLAPVQFEMCLGTKLSSMDSVSEMAQFANSQHLLQSENPFSSGK